MAKKARGTKHHLAIVINVCRAPDEVDILREVLAGLGGGGAELVHLVGRHHELAVRRAAHREDVLPQNLRREFIYISLHMG